MPEWFVAGGWSMWFLLVVGALALMAALGFARRPDPAGLERLHCLSRAVAWGVVTGIATDLAAVATTIAGRPEWAHGPDFGLLVLQGVGESMSPAILGGAVLSIVGLLSAAGHARLRAQGIAP